MEREGGERFLERMSFLNNIVTKGDGFNQLMMSLAQRLLG